MITWQQPGAVGGTVEGVTEASDLGWRPGFWPLAFSGLVPDGTTARFVRPDEPVKNADLVWYTSMCGKYVVRVFND